ncbi:MAG: GldL-related protein [Bacteroidia bacterium]
MKKAMIRTGIFSVVATILGSFFKLMHWPGAGPMIVLGIGSLGLIFIPLMFILKTKDESSKRDKLILALGSLIGICLCCATLFSVMHWPSPTNGFFWFAAICISAFALIPVYFFTGIRNPDTKLNTIVTTIVLIGATGLQFTMINVRPALKLTQIKMYNYIQNEDLLKKMQQKTGNIINQNKFADDINASAEKIKKLILENAIGEPSIPKDFESKDIEMQEGGLAMEFYDNGAGIQLLKKMKDDVVKYNSSGIINEENKIPVDHTILDIELDKIGRYSNYSVLNSITQIQMYLATASAKVTACK